MGAGMKAAVRMAGLTVLLALHPASPKAQERELALVLAVDVSSSMDKDELRLQRAGYVAALSDPGLAEALAATGVGGGMVLTYVEWAGPRFQRVTVPWRVIMSAADARDFAKALDAAPLVRETDTSISNGLTFSVALFPAVEARRKVIDISGDGPNTAGPHVSSARDAVLRQGITINGLPLVLAGPAPGGGVADDLVAYYRDCVIGGEGAFVLAVEGREVLSDAILRKLKTEIMAAATGPRLIAAAGTVPADCTMGQKDFYE